LRFSFAEADAFCVEALDRPQAALRRYGPASRWTIALAALYAPAVFGPPHGWNEIYNVLLFNAPYVAAAGGCFAAATRVPSERVAWLGMGIALGLSAVGNALRVLSAGGNTDWSGVAVGVSLAGYLALYVPVIGLIRARVPRFHPSMWLDGIIAALGSLAAGVAFLLGPYLYPGPGHHALALSELVGPLTDLLLLAVLVSVGSILGVRLDRTLLTMAVALLCTCASDIVLFTLQVQGRYVIGGPLELGWLVSVVLTALAAAGARDCTSDNGSGRSRLGWRLLAVPMACTVASILVLAPGGRHPTPPLASWLAIACVVAGITRIAVTFREVQNFYEFRQQARTDELTGLANRRALLQQASLIIASASQSRPAALLLLDLDGFKEVNDGLGHSAGDDLLCQVGPRLRAALRAEDVLARLGGDEFAVLSPDTGLDEGRSVAHRLRELLLQPFTADGTRVHVGVSIGVATAPVPAANIEELLRCADIAMYTAKRTREGVRVYVPDAVSGDGGDRLRAMEELRTALADDQLLVFLQPQTSLHDGTIVGVEALVRWQHPMRGLLCPADLLPAAEQAGLLRPLADRVLDLALGAAARWWPEHQIPVSVNLSAANVTDLDLPDKVAAALAAHGLPGRALTLEVVEDTLMTDPERGRGVLADLRRLHIRTSIDDYGTGYSSLAYLHNLPADELKLDRSLTENVERDPRAAAIVRHTVALAHDLGLKLVAEGIEDMAMAALLARLGCDIGQGYAIAPPMPVDQFLFWLGTSRSVLLGDSRT
jgi:diguanylate cyclase